jgi:hypothetical protein
MTGDPHIVPFIGSNFDLHHSGTFQLLKREGAAGGVQIQVRLVMCRPAQSWSGGLTAKCSAGFAIQADAHTVLETSYKFNPDEGHFEGSRRLYRNGRPLPMPGTSNIGGLKITSDPGVAHEFPDLPGGSILDSSHSIVADDYVVKISINAYYMTMLFALRTRSLFGKLPGVCGGGGEEQFALAFKKTETEAAKAAGGADIGYPCQKCVGGLGQYGALCSCHEFLVAPAAQLFMEKESLAAWKQTVDTPASQMDQDKLKQARMKCLKAMVDTPTGKLAFGVLQLRSKILANLDDCAIDHDAGIASDSPGLNRKEFEAGICRQVGQMFSPSAPSKQLCHILILCHGSGEGFAAPPTACASLE